MSFNSLLDITASSLAAQKTRLNTIASNMANVDHVAGSQEDVYKPRYPIFTPESVTDSFDTPAYGVSVAQIVESQDDGQAVYWPDHPLANEEGYVFKPNINMMNEMVDMISASRSYQDSVEIFSTARNLMLKTLQMGGAS